MIIPFPVKKNRQASTLPIVMKVTKHLNERELFTEGILPYKKIWRLTLSRQTCAEFYLTCRKKFTATLSNQ